MWLSGRYRDLIQIVKAEAGKQGRVQSLRLVIGDRLQRRAIDPSLATWETYIEHSLIPNSPATDRQLPDGSTDAVGNHVEGFMARVVAGHRLPPRNKDGTFRKRKRRK